MSPGTRFTEMVGTFFGLARDGKVDKKGIPHPLQLALSAQEFSDTMVMESGRPGHSAGPSASSPRSPGRAG